MFRRSPATPAAAPAGQKGPERLSLCAHPQCQRGAAGLRAGLEREAAGAGLALELAAAPTVCDGRCAGGPYLGLCGWGVFYGGLSPADAPEVMAETVAQGRLLFGHLLLSHSTVTDSRLLYRPGGREMVLQEPGMCPVQAALYLLDFRGRESCGKCLPCRLGVHRLWNLLAALEAGGAGRGQLDELAAVAGVMDRDSFCDFGPKAAAPVLLLLELAGDELEGHLDGGCPHRQAPRLTLAGDV